MDEKMERIINLAADIDGLIAQAQTLEIETVFGVALAELFSKAKHPDTAFDTFVTHVRSMMKAMKAEPRQQGR
jgi:hypothetical protein